MSFYTALDLNISHFSQKLHLLIKQMFQIWNNSFALWIKWKWLFNQFVSLRLFSCQRWYKIRFCSYYSYLAVLLYILAYKWQMYEMLEGLFYFIFLFFLLLLYACIKSCKGYIIIIFILFFEIVFYMVPLHHYNS